MSQLNYIGDIFKNIDLQAEIGLNDHVDDSYAISLPSSDSDDVGLPSEIVHAANIVSTDFRSDMLKSANERVRIV